MKALLINAKEQTVEFIDYEDSLEEMYKLIGCDCIDAVDFIPCKDKKGKPYVPTMFVDDEGRLNEEWSEGLVFPCGLGHSMEWPRIIAGNGLVVGIGPEGENVDLEVEDEDAYIREVLDEIRFLKRGKAKQKES